MTGDDFPQVEFPAGVINVNANEIALRVVIQNHAFGNLLALGARTRGEVNVERIRFCPRTGNDLLPVVPKPKPPSPKPKGTDAKPPRR